MRILLFCPYPYDTVPAQRLKYEQYISYLESNGYSIKIIPFFREEDFKNLYLRGKTILKIFSVINGFFRRLILLPSVFSADGIYIALNIVPVGPSLIERLYCLAAKKIIYDIDDMIHLNRTSDVNKIARIFKSNKRYFLLMSKANHVITCTPVLDQLARKYNINTTDISSTINTDLYIPVNNYTQKNQIVIGWSGSYSTSPYLHLLDNVFRELSQKYNIKLLVMGARDFDLSGVNVETVPWSTQTEVPTLQKMDIGVYPLPLDDPWVLGKSGLKALQYMALGIPAVATMIGCNGRVIDDGVSGFLVASHSEWIDRLTSLIEDPHLRKVIGSNARQKVIKEYSIKSNRQKYLDIFNKTYKN